MKKITAKRACDETDFDQQTVERNQ